ncbi:MAG TPA: DUF5916 domain-containing protein, partial [Longimicrobiales bacterium]|nr:DUF5916 domain-containing protein [Longimicrobiales bacterium]
MRRFRREDRSGGNLGSRPAGRKRARVAGRAARRCGAATPPACLLVTALLGFAAAAPAAAQSQNGEVEDLEAVARPELHLAPVRGIVIDGRLDEAAWADIRPITRFIQAEPDAGRPASEDTEVRIGYDARYLYVGADMHDRDPGGIITKSLERDSPGILFEEMDALGIALDTFLDRRSSFLFFVNPMGGIKDGQAFDNGRTRDYGWDGVVDVRTTIHDHGWTLEMAIPWKTLRFDPSLPDQEWGLNVMRRIRRRNEVAYWAPLDRRNRIFLVSLAGTMSGMGRLPANRNLTVKPFTLASRATGSELGAVAGDEIDGGLDVKWGITPSLTLDLTWRTDFSQVEVDREQVNLTRFPLFFPEQREFFLENSGTFTFGDVDGGPGSPRRGTTLSDFTLFHSRQIGLRGGRPVPLVGGGRLTGRVGALEIGLLDVQSESFEGAPAENFGVVRLRTGLGGDSDVGVVLTNRQATGVDGSVAPNRTYGADANLRLFGSLFVNSYVAGSSAGDVSDEAARLSVGWRDRFWDASAAFRHIGEDFSPGIGFVRRRGIREAYATLGVRPRPAWRRVLEVNPYVEATRITGLDGRVQTWSGEGSIGVSLSDRSNLTLGGAERFERLDEPFDVRPGTTIPAGDYRWSELSGRYGSSQGRALSGSVSV